MQTFLGIDSGGTHSRWALIDAAGARLDAGEGDAVQPTGQGVDMAAARLRQLCKAILSRLGSARRPVHALAGVAGAGSVRVRAALRDAVREVLALSITGDPEVAAATALADGAGVALWSGTGSFAVARGADGRLFRVGGRGSLLGDDGGAFAMVRAAAVAVVRAADDLGPATAMASSLCAAFDAAADRLGASMQARTAAEIAAALPLVGAAAAAGDAVARAVLDDGARCLAALAAAAARRARLAQPTATVVLGGGVLTGDTSFAALVTAALREQQFSGEVRLVVRDSAEGAALLARAVHCRQPPMCDWTTDGTA